MNEALNTTLKGLDRGRNAFYSTAERGIVEKLYRSVFGRAMRVSSCPNRWADAVVEMRLFLRKNQNKEVNMNERKYIMKRGVVFMFKGRAYSAANITDEVAKEALTKNKKIAWMFDAIPEEAEEPAKVEENTEGKDAIPEEAEEPAKVEENTEGKDAIPEEAEEPAKVTKKAKKK